MPLTDVEFINSPLEWPRWPVLPMKHRTRSGWEENFTGFLLNRVTPPYVIYLGNFMSLGEKTPKPKTWGEATQGLKTEEYTTVEALLKDWRID